MGLEDQVFRFIPLSPGPVQPQPPHKSRVGAEAAQGSCQIVLGRSHLSSD